MVENRRPRLDLQVFTISDLKKEADKKLDERWRDYYNDGAMDFLTLRENEEAYNRFKIRPRVFVPVQQIDSSTTIFGQRVPVPFGFAPSGSHKLAHPDGELATSRAAAKHGICMALSCYSTSSLEDVADQGLGNPYAIHVCMLRDRGIAVNIIQRAEASGYKAVFVSVDTPVLGLRLSEMRREWNIPEGMTHPNIVVSEEFKASNPESEAMMFDPTLDWPSTIAWLKSRTKMQIWLKGINSPEDVALAAHHGADGVLISNHGGRQLDGTPATIDSLRVCAPVAAGKIALAVDGGIRRGSDIFKAIALGAQFCFLGRVPIWGLAYDGQRGVELALEILEYEFRNVMALAGCRSIGEITRDHLAVLDSTGLLCKL